MNEEPMVPDAWGEHYEAWRVQAEPMIAGGVPGAYEGYPHVVLEEPAPFAPMRVPLARARVALVSSAGLSVPGQAPFDERFPGDPGLRVIDGPGPLGSWRIDHGHYDPTAAREDYNTVFPLDAFRALAEAGEIGEVAPRHISFVGYQADARVAERVLAPAMAEVLTDDAVDLALLVPV